MIVRGKRLSTFVFVGVVIVIAGIATGVIAERGFSFAVVPIIGAGALLWGVSS